MSPEEYQQLWKTKNTLKHTVPDLASALSADLIGQVRQLVDEWNQTLHGEHDAAYNDLIKRIASFAAEAATQGQVAMAREINNCEKCDLCEDHLP